MWDRVMMMSGLGFSVGDMATKAEISKVEEALGVTLPRSLRGFLSEMNGAAINLNGLEPPEGENQVVKLVWSCKETIGRTGRCATPTRPPIAP